PSQIEEEFLRITLKPLLSTFLGKLDQFSPKLLSLYRRKGGAVGKKLDTTLDMLDEIYGDDDAAAIQDALATLVLSIFVVGKAGSKGQRQVGIAIKGTEVLFGVPNVALACAYLMGLIYALELSYRKKLKCTFEVFQKIFLEQEDGNKIMSSKVHDLMVSLHA
ncbi:hypothetical protein ILYODFUR_012291, partial [Ilyodon furcidens]